MKSLHWSPLVLSVAWLTLIGCKERAAERAVEPAKVAAEAPAVLAEAQAQGEPWGHVTGRIIWGGDKIPAQLDLDLKGNTDTAACLKNGPVKDETWIVNPTNKGMKNVFVWLEAPKKGDKLTTHPSLKKVAPDKIEVDQPSCAFIPHAVAIREGQVLVAKNSSGIVHNFKWTGNPAANPGGNVLLPPGASKEIDDLKADRVPVSIECNIHPWMRGWCRVYDHPYFAVTDADGQFSIKNAPAGEFRLKVWQIVWLGGAKGKDGEPITIKPGPNKLDDKLFPPPAD